VSENWSAEELRASVEAYLDMQRKIRSGEKVVKKVYYVALSKQFGRTEKSYEYRMQNISYVLSILGREWVPGLRPAKNVGANVASEIESILASIENRAASPDVSFESQVQNALAKGMQSKRMRPLIRV
jgi:5-methylcytosine-specific restriction protein A